MSVEGSAPLRGLMFNGRNLVQLVLLLYGKVHYEFQPRRLGPSDERSFQETN